MEGAESVIEESASVAGTSHGDNDGGAPSDKETASGSKTGSAVSLDEASNTTGEQSVSRKVLPLL